jgi:GNAT superfamily N-acetyltransferase
MLWRVRTTLADRPGALATLARRCGARSVNILGLQIFPGVEGVTDELVLATPEGWGPTDVADLVETAGGSRVRVGPCTEAALRDGPTHYLHAVRRVAGGAGSPVEVLAGLLDAVPEDTPSVAAEPGPGRDTLEVEVNGRRLGVHRGTPFTATEHARAVAFAEVLSLLDERGLVVPAAEPAPGAAPGDRGLVVRAASVADAAALVALHARCSPDSILRAHRVPLAHLDLRLARRLLVGGAGGVVAVVDDDVVGLATLSEAVDGRSETTLMVEDRHQRKGIGTRLLGEASRRAAAAGAHEVVLRGPAESPAAVAMAFGSGLRARLRLAGDDLLVAISTRGLGEESGTPPPGRRVVTRLTPRSSGEAGPGRLVPRP